MRSGEPGTAKASELEEAQREAEHCRLAEEALGRRLKETEAHSLLERAQRAEQELQRARDELEKRVEERTAEPGRSAPSCST